PGKPDAFLVLLGASPAAERLQVADPRGDAETAVDDDGRGGRHRRRGRGRSAGWRGDGGRQGGRGFRGHALSPGGLLQHGEAELAAVGEGALLSAEAAVFGLLALPLVDLFHQRIDHLMLQDVTDDLAALEDDALALAGGDAEVRLARLARTVDHAAKDAHLDRRLLAA